MTEVYFLSYGFRLQLDESKSSVAEQLDLSNRFSNLGLDKRKCGGGLFRLMEGADSEGFMFPFVERGASFDLFSIIGVQISS